MVYYRHKNCMGKFYQHEWLRNCKNKVNNYKKRGMYFVVALVTIK